MSEVNDGKDGNFAMPSRGRSDDGSRFVVKGFTKGSFGAGDEGPYFAITSL
jgi:hypothetical protein